MSETVLLAEDERDLAEVFTMWLATDYDVRTAYDGDEALELFDRGVDVVLLDRRMPTLSGDEVLQELRGGGYHGPVGMVTAVHPDFDIIEMGFDDYLLKPVKKPDLMEFVADLRSLPAFENAVQRYYELASKKAALESTKSREELARSDEYQALIDELDEVEGAAQSAMAETSNADLFSNL